MKAYVELIQSREREIGCDVLTHQKVRPSFPLFRSKHRGTQANHPSPQLKQWSGADYADAMLMTVTGGVSSTAAMGKGVTENQFVDDKTKDALHKL